MKRPHTRLLATALAALCLAAFARAELPAAPTVASPGSTTVPSEQVQVPGVRSQTAWTYRVGPGGVVGEGHRSSSISYDREGFPLEQITYDENGAVKQRIVNAYDDGGRLAESVVEESGGMGDARTLFEYEGELLTGTTALRPDGTLLVSTRFEYDEDGNVVATLTEVPEADLSLRMAFEYSEVDDVVRMFSYDTAGNVIASSETVNDGNGNPLVTSAYEPDGTMGSITTYRYDSEGRPLEVAVRDSEGRLLSVASKTYGPDGLMVELVTSNPAAGIEQRVAVEYDEANSVLTERTYNKLGQLVSETRYVYEYYVEEDDERDDTQNEARN
jgi:YD repeat-containing protein